MSKIFLLFLFIFSIEFLIDVYVITNSLICIPLYLGCSFLFLYKSRRNHIVCPEVIILLFSFIVIFYKEIVIENIEIASLLFDQFSTKQYLRGLCLSMIAFFAFLSGVSYYSSNTSDKKLLVVHRININKLRSLLPIFITLYLLFAIATGKIQLANHYSNSSVEFSNTHIVFVTILVVVATLIEFIHLNESAVSSLSMTLKSINKSYLILALLFFILLLLIGYRSGAMLVVLPILISYSIFISDIKTKVFILLLFSGILLMVFIGFLRSGEGMSNSITFFDSFRDFGPAYLTNVGLISFTDAHGASGLGLGLRSLLSSIPFLGGIVDVLFPSSYSLDDQSAVLATRLFQDRNNLESGLGTSLVGDLYFSGHLIWVIFYMYFLGRLLNFCYIRLYTKRKIGIFTLVFYLWIFANSVFLLRSEWYSYFRYIGFSWVIIYVVQLLYTKSRKIYR